MEMVKADVESFHHNGMRKCWNHVLQTLQSLQDLEKHDAGKEKGTGGCSSMEEREDTANKELGFVVDAGKDEDANAVMGVIQQMVDTVVWKEANDERINQQKQHLKLLMHLGGDLYDLGVAFDPKERTNGISNVNVLDELGRATDGGKRKPLMDDELTAQLGEGRLEHAIIVFCTLATAGSTRMKRFVSYVDTLIVDEAAQALEAEVVIPLALGGYGFEKIDPKTGRAVYPFTGVRNLVLIGDPKQLPAIITNKQTEKSGRGTSCMQRLMEEARQPVSAHLLNTQYRYCV